MQTRSTILPEGHGIATQRLEEQIEVEEQSASTMHSGLGIKTQRLEEHRYPVEQSESIVHSGLGAHEEQSTEKERSKVPDENLALNRKV
jgi:hypothetical protein